MNVLPDVYICPLKDQCTSSSWGDSKMHTYGTIANSQGMADETNENDAISTVRILVQKVIMSDIWIYLA